MDSLVFEKAADVEAEQTLGAGCSARGPLDQPQPFVDAVLALLVEDGEGVGGGEAELGRIEAEELLFLEVLLDSGAVELVAVDDDGDVQVALHVFPEPQEQQLQEGAAMPAHLEHLQELVLALETRRRTRAHQYNRH